MNRIVGISLLAAAVFMAVACGSEPGTRDFPTVSVPSVYSGPEDIVGYQAAHFWDAFLDTGECFLCDSVTVNGVSDESLSKAALTYAQILLSTDLSSAQNGIMEMFRKLETFQTAFPESNVFGKMTELVSSIEYDANSPLRDEDIYGPFAEAVSSSRFCPAGRAASYADEAECCALNRRGTKAADFEFTDMQGIQRDLYGVEAEWTVLNFINPGCNACNDVAEAFSSPVFEGLSGNGKVRILGIYIDEELDKWFEESGKLPAFWTCGYDADQTIRGERLYDVRAIPSVYLLDKEKKVILKDAPVDRVLAYIQNFVL